MKIALQILLFSIVLNMAGGIIIHYFPEITANPEYLGGAVYSDSEVDAFADAFNKTIDTSSEAQDQNSLLDNILDKLNIGIIGKVQAVFKQYMYGAIDILGQLFGLDSYIMGRLHIFMIIAYVLAIISLFTGKDFRSG